MKLSEYFQQQKSQVMTSQMKSQLFSRIQKNKNVWMEYGVKLPSNIFFFASKRIIYASLATILIIAVFWWVLLDKNDIVDFWIFSINKHINPNGVRADYVAEIIWFNWEYSVVRDWLEISNLQDLRLIEDWDVITLSEWTNFIFTLMDGTQGKIVWPAEFSIVKIDERYEISLVDWKFFRMYCPDCTSDIDIITPDLLIHQGKNQLLDVHIAKEDDEMLVKNDWDDIKITTKQVDNVKGVILNSTDLIAIAPDSETINIFNDEDFMSTFMAKNNISATFTLSTDKVEWPTIQQKPSDEMLAMQTSADIEGIQNENSINDKKVESIEQANPLLEWIIEVISSDLVVTWNVDEAISAELWITMDEQGVPSPDQMQSLKNNLNSFFLMNIFESIYNGDKVQQNIWKLADRINSLSSSFGYQDRTNANLSDIKSTIITLKEKLEKDRYISPSYILQLEKVAKWCDELSNPSQDDRESLKADLPIYLRLM